MANALRTTLGISLLVGGVIGALLPVIPGIPLLVAGAAVLGPNHRLIRPLARWLKRRPSDESKRLSGGGRDRASEREA